MLSSPDNASEASLVLDNAVGDAHLAAERGQEDDQLDGIHVVGDQDQLGLLLLNLT
jgi:hypothetical protein